MKPATGAASGERAFSRCARERSLASATMASLIQRSELQRAQIDSATTQFNNAVDLYNKAVAQFPANVLAWVFGFKQTRAL